MKIEFYRDLYFREKVVLRYKKNTGLRCCVNEDVNIIYWKPKQILGCKENNITGKCINLDIPFNSWEYVGTIELIPLYFISMHLLINYLSHL